MPSEGWASYNSAVSTPPSIHPETGRRPTGPLDQVSEGYLAANLRVETGAARQFRQIPSWLCGFDSRHPLQPPGPKPEGTLQAWATQPLHRLRPALRT
jgi:hypothetical protein